MKFTINDIRDAFLAGLGCGETGDIANTDGFMEGHRLAHAPLDPLDSKAMLERIHEAHRPGREAMDEAALIILAAGWNPAQCTVKHYRAPDGTVTETLMCDVSIVDGYIRGHEVFELTTSMTWQGDKLVIEQKPRFIALPPAPPDA